MDRSIVVCIFSIVLLVLQSTQGAELNSETTLNCNGKEFKCINATHYQPCSLTERSGQQPQYTINGVTLPCAMGKSCDESSSFGCSGVARTAKPVDQPSQIPVEVTIVQEPAKVEAPAVVAAVVESVAAPAKSLPVEEPAVVPAAVPVVATPVEETVASSTEQVRAVAAEETKSAEQAAAPAPAPVATPAPTATPAKENVTDAVKADEAKPKKKFSFKGLKKVGPMRLVKGFRAATWRPKISLDSQKDVADSLRKRIFERRNKYEKFVENVLGKATPTTTTSIAVQTKPDAKQPAPGAPIQHDPIDVTRLLEFWYDESETATTPSSDDVETTTMIVASLVDAADGIDHDDDDTADEIDHDDGANETPDEIDHNDDDVEHEDYYSADRPHKKPSNNNENQVVVETNPVNHIHVEAPQITNIISQPIVQQIIEPVAVSGCSDCESCENCEVIEKPCQTCDRPCKCDRPPCKHCERPCCEKPPCHECGETVAVITTIEVVESCPAYEEVIYNDEPILVETNYTITSTYEVIQSEFAQQQLEAQQFQQDQQLARKGICGDGGLLHGIHHDEEDLAATNTSTTVALIGVSDKTKGHIIANIANGHNNKPSKPCQITSGWSCGKFGRHPHPSHCQKFIQCHLCGDNTVYECPYEQSFDGRQCTSDWSNCGHIHSCQYDRELLADPWNKSNYFICVRKKGFLHKFFVFRRFCPEDHEFDPVRQQCYRIKVVVVVKPKPPCKHCQRPEPCKYGCNT